MYTGKYIDIVFNMSKYGFSKGILGALTGFNLSIGLIFVLLSLGKVIMSSDLIVLNRNSITIRFSNSLLTAIFQLVISGRK